MQHKSLVGPKFIMFCHLERRYCDVQEVFCGFGFAAASDSFIAVQASSHQSPLLCCTESMQHRPSKEKLPSPSSFADNTDEHCWASAKLRGLLPIMRTHRPAKVEGERFQPLPVALLDRTLGQVKGDCVFGHPVHATQSLPANS